MADTSTTGTTPVDQSGPLDAGHTTSEFHVSIVSIILGGLATVVGYATTILQVLPPDLKWVGIASSIAGLLTVLLTALGYQVTRTSVKAAAIKAGQTTVTVLPAEQAAAKVFGS